MARFEAIFAKSVDLIETDYYSLFPLTAATLAEAQAEALQLARPPGANILKIMTGGRVAHRIWLPLGE